MKHVNPSSIVVSFRSLQQQAHGKRVEERQRVNGQPNGYRPVSEADLQSLHCFGTLAKNDKPAHGGYCA